jgi:mannan endo-1,4-beta-mannosidase
MRKSVAVVTGVLSVLPFTWMACTAKLGTSNPKQASAAPTRPAKTVLVEDFETYASDEQLAKAWYKPPHGGAIHQSRESAIKNSGNFSMKVAYSTTRSSDKFYSPICRVSKWDLSGCDAMKFWLRPDGSGRALLVELNIANREGKNIHDLWDYTYVPQKGDTSPRLVTVPFAKLVKNAKYADSPDTSPVFKPESLIEVALCIAGRSDEPGDGVYYFDDFKGVLVNSQKR